MSGCPLRFDLVPPPPRGPINPPAFGWIQRWVGDGSPGMPCDAVIAPSGLPDFHLGWPPHLHFSIF